MSRSESARRHTRAPAPVEDDSSEPLSKTRRKAQMHALQDLGEAVVALEPRQLAGLLAEVELPERLREAIVGARAITAWGGRKRQLQYIGKLMREIDPEPIERWLQALAQGRRISAARQHALERWRDRLLEDNEALDALSAAHPALDRPRLRALIHRAREERTANSPPHAYRELFRALNETIPHDAEPAPPQDAP